jgi:hypothetical protein
MLHSFTSWVRNRQRLDDLMPQADKVVPLVASAGTTGMTRRQLGHGIDLDRDVLEELLAGLVRAGLLTLAWEQGVPVYRATSGFNLRPGLPS